MHRVQIDTGPLVAWFDADEGHHAAVARFLAGFRGEFLTTWPVITEVCHLVPPAMVPSFIWAADGGLTVVELPASALGALADRMGKYADLPMDAADASLIWLAETAGVLDILTVGRQCWR